MSFVCDKKALAEKNCALDDVGEQVGGRRLVKPNSERS